MLVEVFALSLALAVQSPSVATKSPGLDATPVDALRAWVAAHGLDAIEAQPFASTPLTRAQADAARSILWSAHAERIRRERSAEIEARVIEVGGARMPIWFTTFGEKPADGRSLWISMHGGGGAPKQVNDQQWENQKRLYKPAEGIYLAPRAPSDEWNLWHQAPVDALFDRLIEDLVVLEDVNPDRVYIMGYSAGGDGVYQLAPRMADRLAAAAMMAGHPNDAKPDGLRNIGFALHVGALDGAYDRNKVAAGWKETLDGLERDHPGAYRHQAELHEGKAHWMDLEDAKAIPWMAAFTRDLRPRCVTWLQDDVTHDRFYWLAVDDPKAGALVEVERDGQTFRVTAARDVDALRVRLDDAMCDLDKEIVVTRDGRELFRGQASRTIATMAKTLAERGDPRGIYAAEIRVPIADARPTDGAAR
ncbi:MAG: hypothetical protein U0572_04290 [Phycisphaerales bacterium]